MRDRRAPAGLAAGEAAENIGGSSAGPLEPFPLTEQQVAKAVGDLSLKLPFGYGYEPRERC